MLKFVLIISLAFLTNIFLSYSAQALSCVKSSPIEGFKSLASQTDNEIVVVYGYLEFDGEFKSDRHGGAVNPKEVTKIIRGSLSGENLEDGSVFSEEINIEQYCISAWCGSIDQANYKIFLLENINNERVLKLHPCGGSAFDNENVLNSEDDVATFRNCLRNNNCDTIGDENE